VIGTTALFHRIDGTGADLVLLHGGGGSSDDLAGLRTHLVTSHRVISPEQRGHGRSAFAEPLSYAAMAADTAALLDGLGVRAADFVGWSDGGVVALTVARDRPDLVRRLVAIGTNVDAGPGEPHHLTPESAAEQAALTPEQLGLEPRFSVALVAMWRAPHDISLGDLRAIAAPVLFVAGDRDLITLDHTVAMYRAASDGQLAILPRADHAVPVTEPATVAALIQRFLAE
jgi:pimeloyl-ACP methyl ester carboxylesterase